jgi:hypothetical protein
VVAFFERVTLIASGVRGRETSSSTTYSGKGENDLGRSILVGVPEPLATTDAGWEGFEIKAPRGISPARSTTNGAGDEREGGLLRLGSRDDSSAIWGSV